MTSNLSQYNLKSAGVKRLMKEAAELRNPTDMYYAQPLEDNLFEWHFTVRGPADTDFENGIYHGRILLPVDYPMKPPSVILLTPNGRFQLNQKICLSISDHHPESWQPSWSIRTALLALIGFMPTHSAGALGSLEYPSEERRRLAKISHEWVCKECGLCMRNALASKPVCDDNADIIEAQHLTTEISVEEEKTAIKQEIMDDQKFFVTSDTILKNDVITDSTTDTSENLRHRLSSSQSHSSQLPSTSITSIRSDDLQLSSHRYSWELIFIWFFSVIIIGLVLRRLLFVQNHAIA